MKARGMVAVATSTHSSDEPFNINDPLLLAPAIYEQTLYSN
jgi:hypothetical protein